MPAQSGIWRSRAINLRKRIIAYGQNLTRFWECINSTGFRASNASSAGLNRTYPTTAAMHRQSLAAILLSAGSALAAPMAPAADIKCPIVFDGRVPVGTASTFFDTYATNTIFNPDYVKGNDLKWSQILQFPTGDPSRFDGTNFTALEVTLSDKSIFQKQNGFRRAGLQFLKDAADGPGTTGVKTLHFSVKQDSARKLNLTHEYLVRAARFTSSSGCG